MQDIINLLNSLINDVNWAQVGPILGALGLTGAGSGLKIRKLHKRHSGHLKDIMLKDRQIADRDKELAAKEKKIETLEEALAESEENRRALVRRLEVLSIRGG